MVGVFTCMKSNDKVSDRLSSNWNGDRFFKLGFCVH